MRTEQSLMAGQAFEPFIKKDADEDKLNEPVRVEYLEVKELPKPVGRKVCQKTGCYEYASENQSMRYYGDFHENEAPYACSMQNEDGTWSVLYLPGKKTRMVTCRTCLHFLPLEKVLLDYGRIILHASCIKTSYGGILFSGQSGIGKSTQAELWRTLENSEIINGDRVIIYKENGVWMASGSPYAGSSCYYVDKQVPIRAVVMLDQADACRIYRMSMVETFKSIYSGLTINGWNVSYMEQLCDICKQLVGEVPVYHLACTPDANAIKTLKTVLE